MPVYTGSMHRVKRSIAIAAWLSLFLLQLSGVHAHANENGYLSMPETGYSHVHITDHDHDTDHDTSHQDAHHHGEADHSGTADHSHDYEDARDVSIFELASGKFKLTLATLALVLLLCVLPGEGILVSTVRAERILSGRHTRWRPPLRAPPLPS